MRYSVRNMLRCRRGSAAFATVVALVPLIGAVALGAEAGSWYVTRNHAQNAADAGAYSGALKLACDIAATSGVACNDTTGTVDSRGKQFAAQNAFCNTNDTSYTGSRCATTMPSGVSQTVTISQLTSWNGVSGNFVQAVVTQQQPAYLAALLGLSTVTVGAVGTAQVVDLGTPCVLTLSDPLAFQGNPTVKSPNCGLASNNPNADSINFTGNSADVSNVKSMSAQGSCTQTSGSRCSNVVTYAPPAPNPLSGLDTAIAALTKASFSGGSCGSSLKSYSATNSSTTGPCYNTSWPSGSATLSGVYFLTGNIRINGSVTISGTTTLILMPPKFLNNGDQGASLTISGNPTIQLNALSSVSTSQVPPALSSVVGLMAGLLIYDPESSTNVNITGSSTTYFNGITYLPNADVTYQGNTSQTASCVEVIAKGITLSGSANFDNSGCPASVTARSKYVRMVQ
ncbi:MULTISPECIES: pilus assembly protein TadG-related protein [unclassified Bradyrhizobium]